jgi:chromosomal replication initiator protein
MQSGIAHAGRAGSALGGEKVDKEDGAGAPKGAEAVFERVKAQLKARLGNEVYNNWFGSMMLADASRSVVRLSVPTAFLKLWVNGHYADLIDELWKKDDPDILKVEIVVRSATRAARPVADKVVAEKPATRRQSAATPQSAARPERYNIARASEAGTSASPGVTGSPLDSRYTFDSFIEGPSNRMAFAAARAVAEQAANAVRFNPLFLHASVGLGKTHLLQAIAAGALKRDPSARVLYLTAEYFMWRFATAIRDNNALTFKEQLRGIDLLIIDDMQFLQGKSIQHEFCHLINLLLDSARQVVVAADRPPSELESLEPRVRSRLNGGVALEISAPDFDMRFAMLKQRLETAKVDDGSLDLPEEILAHVARPSRAAGANWRVPSTSS